MFWIVSLRTSTFSRNAMYFDTGRPSGTCGRGFSSIRALQLAWCALKSFFRREWIGRFPGFPCMRPILYVRIGKKLSVFVALSRAHSPEHIPQVGNRIYREHDITTLPPMSVSRQHRACVTRPSALYCCGYSSWVHRSLRSVIHRILVYLSLAVSDPCSLWTEM